MGLRNAYSRHYDKTTRARCVHNEQGAQTIIYLASSSRMDGKNGGYYVKSNLATPTKEAQSDSDAKRLWDVSVKITGMGF